MKIKLQKDFSDFISEESIKVPQELNQKILLKIRRDLNPSHLIVFSKLLTVQAFIGTLTLLFCPQFNLSLTNNSEVFHYFHRNFGESICMLVCGSIFMGSGAILSAYLLKEMEIKKIVASKYLYYLSLTSTVLTAFLILGADVYLNIVFFWFLGAIISGVTMFEINRMTRSKIFSYLRVF